MASENSEPVVDPIAAVGFAGRQSGSGARMDMATATARVRAPRVV